MSALGRKTVKNGTAEVRNALARVKHLTNLPDEAREAIARAAVHRQFDVGQVIYLEGEPANAMYILASGWVKAVHMSPEGREQAMLFLRPAEVFGDVAVFTGTSYPCTVIALEPVDVWTVERTVVIDLVARYPELALAVIRRLGERVLYYVGLVEDLSLRSVESRLAHTLLRHVEDTDGRLIVPRRSWTTFDEMATRLGTVRDVLSRALRTLEEEGLVHVERNEIIILDPDGLAERGNPQATR